MNSDFKKAADRARFFGGIEISDKELETIADLFPKPRVTIGEPKLPQGSDDTFYLVYPHVTLTDQTPDSKGVREFLGLSVGEAYFSWALWKKVTLEEYDLAALKAARP